MVHVAWQAVLSSRVASAASSDDAAMSATGGLDVVALKQQELGTVALPLPVTAVGVGAALVQHHLPHWSTEPFRHSATRGADTYGLNV
jgi:hypothetical protein